ncbi:MAG: 16S rRNA (cytosine(1402)-N(4))-methyltransferase RsmH [Oscillospiraceae bacterium]|jgi:16S rRNA (cytosine1402-N4)-methyltransferase|nr:16S rRNA (cytosine(1402)-N(4))-methyltransferase RsmH [Oscillospiraceae bacterium]
MNEFRHVTVLLRETVSALRPRPGGHYLDGTAGGGGHTGLLLEKIQHTGRIEALDRDPDAIAALKKRFAGEPAVTVTQGNFFQAARLFPHPGFHGILLDLGVSSHQLDTPERGFSFHTSAPLDMRMEQDGPTARDLVNTLDEPSLRRILRDYAQEKYAPQIARAMVAQRSAAPIETTTQLADLIAAAVPAAYRREGHPARKTFMALRYACNGELDGLEEALLSLFNLLQPEGRLAVITFNSLEDAAMKRAARQLTAGCTCPPEFPVCVCGKSPRAHSLKPVFPSPEEIERNPRARSAKLRVLERR